MQSNRPKPRRRNLGLYSGTMLWRGGQCWLAQGSTLWALSISKRRREGAPPPSLRSLKALAGKSAYVRGIRRHNRIEVSAAFDAEVTIESRFKPAERRKFNRVRAVIQRQRDRLMSFPGVIGVRAGYKFAAGWTTSQPAIVVTVINKTRIPFQPLPDTLDGVPVDVAPATPLEQVAAAVPDQLPALVRAIPAPDPLALPDWHSYEPGDDARGIVDAAFAAVAKGLIAYEPPDVPLDPVDVICSMLCHSSPDAGWPTLKAFLNGIQQRLTLAMYDFTAPHILTELQQIYAAQNTATLNLILDPSESLTAPGGNGNNPKANDIDETVVRDTLQGSLGGRFAFEWAAVQRQGKTTQGIFPEAYHIKLAVRDGDTYWHSSGNWQSSNQPDVTPIEDPSVDLNKLLVTFNREWHLVVANATLAKVFEAYIQSDIAEAKPLQASASIVAVPSLMMADAAASEMSAAVTSPGLRLFQPLSVTSRKIKIQPLLTPDNFLEHVIPLIQSATTTLFLQNQYIKIPKKATQEFVDLLNAVQGRINAGIDVRIIVRDLPDTRQQLEALQAFGFDMTHFKVQPQNHNKGIVVDSTTVVVGSHNWSNDGVLRNRDASQIIFDAPIARYFEQIFLHDWDNLARQRTLAESSMPLLTVPPAGFQAVSLSDLV